MYFVITGLYFIDLKVYKISVLLFIVLNGSFLS